MQRLIEREFFPNFIVGDKTPVHIMGIVNLSPESFYADSFIPKDHLQKTITEFISQGATILDFGARSTAPWSDPITLEQESDRMLNALELTFKLIPHDIIVSIDTQYSAVARLALEFGTKHNLQMMINDISSFQTDPTMIDVLLEYNCPVIIMATFEKPGDAKSPSEIIEALQIATTELKKRGFDTQKIIIDPGIGKWVKDKTYQYDLAMLDQLNQFRTLSCPILVGLARKSFIGSVLDEKDAKQRGCGSWSATAIAVYNGAHIIRTHDVDRTMRQVIQMASAIRGKHFTKNSEKSAVIDQHNEILKTYRKEW